MSTLRDQTVADQIDALHSTHRCIAPQELYPVTYGIGWDREQLENTFKLPQYASLKWRYFNTPGQWAYDELIRTLPLTVVFDTFNTLTVPIYADFTEMTGNLDFMSISSMFYYQLFIQESIFVSYNFFDSNEYKLPDHAEQDIKEKIEALKDRGGFDLWIKVTDNELDLDIEFIHIETNLKVKIPKWRSKLVQVRWGAIRQGNFRNWMNIAVSYLTKTALLDNMYRLAGKRLLISTSTGSHDIVDKVKSMLRSHETTLHMNNKDMANVTEIEYVSGELIKALNFCVYSTLDREMSEFGRVTNTNPKGERITTAENYKDLVGIANRQKQVLEWLKYFAGKAKELWSIELDFAVSGIPEKEALQTVSHRANTPNMEVLQQGQVEGTAPRVPNKNPMKRPL